MTTHVRRRLVVIVIVIVVVVVVVVVAVVVVPCLSLLFLVLHWQQRFGVGFFIVSWFQISSRSFGSVASRVLPDFLVNAIDSGRSKSLVVLSLFISH